MTVENMRKKLYGLAETDYKDFNKKLLPGVEHIIGIRLPAMRSLAKETAKGDFRSYLDEAKEKITLASMHEEIMMQGLVIGYAKMDREERKTYLDEFVPKIRNWAVCDSFCNSLAPRFPGDGAALWDFLRPLYPDSREYYARVACVVQLSHFVDSEHLEEGLSLLQQVKHPGYYAKMAAAWALSEWYVKFPQAVGQLLAQQTLEPWVQNKAIQKVRESRRVSKAEKDALLRYKLQPTP